MQDLCSEIGEFGCLLKGDLIQGDGMWDHPRIRGQDAIDVLPHLNLVQSQCRTERRRRQVAATPAEGGDLSVGVMADESRDHRYRVGIDALFKGLLHAAFVTGQELGVPEITGCLDADVPRIKGQCRHPQLVQSRGHDPDAASFTVRDELIQRLGREFLDHAHARQHLLTFVQEGVDILPCVIVHGELVHGVDMEGPDGIDAHAALLEGNRKAWMRKECASADRHHHTQMHAYRGQTLPHSRGCWWSFPWPNTRRHVVDIPWRSDP
jgi:hypothetical protein